MQLQEGSRCNRLDPTACANGNALLRQLDIHFAGIRSPFIAKSLLSGNQFSAVPSLIVFSLFQIRINFETNPPGLNKFNALLGIQHQNTCSTFKLVQTKLLTKEEELLKDQISRNRREEHKLCRADLRTVFKDGKPVLTVKIDGSRSKTSNFSFVVVLSARSTGKVLDSKFLSKYCNKCNMKAKDDGTDPEPCEKCNVST